MLIKEPEHSKGRDRSLTKEATGAESVSILSGPVDAMLLLAEWGFRQVYWRSSWLRQFVKRILSRKSPAKQVANKQEFMEYLRGIGVVPGALVMVHTSLSGLSLTSGAGTNDEPESPLKMAQELLAMLMELIGESGTLVMPTQPVYKVPVNDSRAADQPPIHIYNPDSTPCGMGLVNEFFRRQPGTLRSLYPHNPLAARGPLAGELLKDNLTDSKPLPHGTQSGYYRFCQRNGLVIAIGIPLAKCFTVTHTAEEVRDEQWPVADFFDEQDYIIRNNGVEKTVTIRKTRTEFMKFSLCGCKHRRDLVSAGVLHEGRVGTIRVDWAHSDEVLRFILERNRSSTYPFFGTSFVTRKDLRSA